MSGDRRGGATPPVSPELGAVVSYLADIGYREIYQPPPPRPGVDAVPAEAVVSEAVVSVEREATLKSEATVEADRADAPGPPRSSDAAPAEAVAPPSSAVVSSSHRSLSTPPTPEATAVDQEALFDSPSPPGRGPALDVPDDPDARAALLTEVAAEASGCTACRLCETRRTVVFGSGNPHAELMFIGEGPGANEDRQGLPFVGAAGQLLTKIIEAIDYQREDVYIANMVKCRPPNNRDPEADEVEACATYLERQIALVQPKVIVALGRVAAQALLQTKTSLGRLRGRWHRVHGVAVRATYHPAALLRNASYKRPTWEDLQIVRDALAGEDQELR